MTLDTANTIIQALFSGICLFCCSLLLVRRRDPGVYLPLALLFGIQGVSSLVGLVTDYSDHGDEFGLAARIGLLFSLPEAAVPFLFWLYVRALTSEGEVERVPKLRYHIVPMVITALLIGSALFMPSGLEEADLPEDSPLLVRIVLIVIAIFVADVLFRLMVAVYLFLTIRRLIAYHKRLRDVFATTENREMTWIWVITICGLVYLCMSLAFSVSIWVGIATNTAPSDLPSLLDSLALLVLFWVLGVWGLRQRPGLIRSPLVDPPEPDDDPPTRKYEKSALDEDRAARIAQKIEAAMVDDQLYRDPNLSLWDLAKHIGVTSHYVSQTLNTLLESSFFDYINRWRIQDAVEQLTSTDETILVVAYDVGFNSRSAFYKAFKRETGKTPSDVRK